MAERRLVRAAGAEFYVEVTDVGGPVAIRGDSAFSLDGVRSTVEAIATELTRAWEKVRPSEATVEFGLNLTTKSGRLTGMVVEGGAGASLKVTLTWTHGAAAPRRSGDADSSDGGGDLGSDGVLPPEGGTGPG